MRRTGAGEIDKGSQCRSRRPSLDAQVGGRWLVPYFGDDMMQIVTEAFAKADALLLGRKTYEIFAAHWPRVTDPEDAVATGLNRLPKHVVSKTLQKVEWQHSTLIPGDVRGRSPT